MSGNTRTLVESCGLFRVSVEIRSEIYRHLLSSKYIRKEISYQVSAFDVLLMIFLFFAHSCVVHC